MTVEKMQNIKCVFANDIRIRSFTHYTTYSPWGHQQLDSNLQLFPKAPHPTPNPNPQNYTNFATQAFNYALEPQRTQPLRLPMRHWTISTAIKKQPQYAIEPRAPPLSHSVYPILPPLNLRPIYTPIESL